MTVIDAADRFRAGPRRPRPLRREPAPAPLPDRGPPPVFMSRVARNIAIVFVGSVVGATIIALETARRILT